MSDEMVGNSFLRAASDVHEDVRRSLEVLDSVLAEFDDGSGGSRRPSVTAEEDCCHENGDILVSEKSEEIAGNIPLLPGKRVGKVNGEHTEDIPPCYKNGHSSSDEESLHLQRHSIDGSTSQTDASSPNLDQSRKYSPPPVPKRSPTTKLSVSDNIFFSRESSPTHSSRSLSIHNDASDDRLSPESKDVTKSLVLSNDTKRTPHSSPLSLSNGNITPRSVTTATPLAGGVDQIANLSDSAEIEDDENHFPHRSFAASDEAVDVAMQDDEVFTSLPQKKADNRQVTQFISDNLCRACGCRLIATAAMQWNGEICHSSLQRRRVLDKKFEKTKLLLRTKQIAGLDQEPPSFKPPPPPPHLPKIVIINNVAREGKSHSVSELSVTCSDAKQACDKSEKSGKQSAECNGGPRSPSVLCDSCIKKGWRAVRPMINHAADVPKLLPTDALNRPQLGLSYSMEEDLSPGIKEIKCSTPKYTLQDKSDSSRLSLVTKEQSVPSVHLSTFSQSVSSLGDGSSQSDVDLNISLSLDSDKVPVSILKSRTLPIGSKLTPSVFYSPIESGVVSNGHPDDSSCNGDVRSSSAPPSTNGLHSIEKKSKRGFSRKDKKSKKTNKNDDNLSLKSDLSETDGIILKKLEPLDGSIDMKGSDDTRQPACPPEEKWRRKSVWRGFLRKKEK